MSENIYAKLIALESSISPVEAAAEHQKVVDATKDMPRYVLGHISDQKTYNAFRYGLSMREAIEAGMVDGNAIPGDIDLKIAKEVIAGNYNRSVYNQGAFDERIDLIAGAYGDDFDPDAPIMPDLSSINLQQLSAVIAGLHAAGGLPSIKERVDLVSSGKKTTIGVGDYTDAKIVFDALADAESTDVDKLLELLPSYGGLRGAAERIYKEMQAEGANKYAFGEMDTNVPTRLLEKMAADRIETANVENKRKAAEALEAERAEEQAESAARGAAEAAARILVLAAENSQQSLPSNSGLAAILKADIDKVRTGEDQKIIIPISADKKESPVQKTPEELIQGACVSPAAMQEAMKNQDTPQALKNAMRSLVDSTKKLNSAEAVADVWSSMVEPLIKSIDNNGLQRLEYEFTKAVDTQDATLNAVVGMARTVSDSLSGGQVEDQSAIFSKLRNKASELVDLATTAPHLKKVESAIDDLMRDINRASIPDEDVDRILKKVQLDTADPTDEDIAKLFADHGAEIAKGVSSILRVGEALDTEAESVMPNWKTKQQNIVVLMTTIKRVFYSEGLDHKTDAGVKFRHAAENVYDNTNKMYQYINGSVQALSQDGARAKELFANIEYLDRCGINAKNEMQQTAQLIHILKAATSNALRS
jgi:hypothetical protein